MVLGSMVLGWCLGLQVRALRRVLGLVHVKVLGEVYGQVLPGMLGVHERLLMGVFWR